jgi:hypothetical protein
MFLVSFLVEIREFWDFETRNLKQETRNNNLRLASEIFLSSLQAEFSANY